MSLFLARRGFSVALYETRPDMRRVDISAGRSINLALANRGIDALSRVGVMRDIESHLIPMRGRMIHDHDGGLQLQPYGNKPGEVIYSVSRGALNKALMDAAEAAGVAIRFNQRCDHVDLAGKKLTFSREDSGEQQVISYHKVIGADGGGSVVRGAIAAASGGAVSDEPLDHGYKELTVPAGPGGDHRMETNALHIWPRGGYMLIALPNTDGSFTATLFLPHEGGNSFESLRTPDAVEAFFDRQFPDAVPLIDNLAHSFFANPTGRLGTVRCQGWHDGGNGLLIGDAAHAVVPFHGQGMNAGFEDCVALDRQLETHGDNWAAAFSAFEAERKPSADAIADMALENYIEMRDSVRDPKFQLRKELAWKLETLYPDQFIPRYSMVMFHLLPYADAYARGRIQAAILEDLTKTADTLDQVDLDHARKLVEDRILTLPIPGREEAP